MVKDRYGLPVELVAQGLLTGPGPTATWRIVVKFAMTNPPISNFAGKISGLAYADMNSRRLHWFL